MFRTTLFFVTTAAILCAKPLSAADLEWIAVSKDKRGFVQKPSGKAFTPWGFNYDHDGSGRLIEDYWDKDWKTIEADFREMKSLGANVVRIHLQFGKFMDAPAKPKAHSLDQLGKLLKLAEREKLYLDLTGLGCYHKKDVPKWYDALSEEKRWKAQAAFWEAVARRCRKSPAVFCYDLMNEPVVPGGRKKRDDWLGPGFGDKHFVQFITLAAKGRKRHEIAKQWIGQLVDVIRKHDKRHLITVGLVPWSLDRPGLTSGFVPSKVAGRLDFIAMHLYPKSGNLKEDLKTLKGFQIGKPVVIEEIFPLKCSIKELEAFLDESRNHAAGWIGFYWGQTPAELRQKKTIGAAITAGWLELFQKRAKAMKANGS